MFFKWECFLLALFKFLFRMVNCEGVSSPKVYASYHSCLQAAIYINYDSTCWVLIRHGCTRYRLLRFILSTRYYEPYLSSIFPIPRKLNGYFKYGWVSRLTVHLYTSLFHQFRCYFLHTNFTCNYSMDYIALMLSGWSF